jgi:hypothetical protein
MNQGVRAGDIQVALDVAAFRHVIAAIYELPDNSF